MSRTPSPYDDDRTLLAPRRAPRPGVWRQRARRIALGLAAVLVLGFAWLWFAPCGLGGCAPVSDLEKFQAEGSELLDVNGKPWGTLATVDRRVVPLDSLPEYLPKAFLAVEDRRFFQHSGVDWKRMGGAMKSLFGPGRAEGGSTITMQLARNLFPDKLNYRERSPRRKLMEIRVARQIERAFPKEKILELYVNHIYLGEGAYGVEAAAREYFGKPASQLTLAEAALIGGLPKAPSQINPREDRKAARERRNLVLREMAKAGYVPAEEAEKAMEQPIRLKRSSKGRAERGAYFKERVRRELEEHVGSGFYTAGLRVHTTYDPRAQAAAEEELARQLDAVEAGTFGRYRHATYPEARGESEDGTTPYLQGAVIVMDAATGEVRALVGGRDYDDSKFNRATQAVRQPGSAFKPFIYLTALREGRDPTYRMEDAPLRLTLAGGEVWEPRNYTGRYDGPLTLREALTRSKNTVTVRLAQEVGMSEVARTAKMMGISSPISPHPATALGASEVRPLELTQAYAALANGGQRVEPHFVRRIESRDGEVLWEAEPETQEVVDPAAAFVLTSMLQDVVNRGTGTPARTGGYGGPAAGKTGTTNGATDIWFVGYTPELVTTVWMGLDRPRTIVPGASGGTVAAPVWGRIMGRIYAGKGAPRPWSPPSGVTTAQVDRLTGMPLDAGCPAQGGTYTEYFLNGGPPRGACSTAPYPTMAGADTAWMDEEWAADGAVVDTLGQDEVAPGVYWPELDSMRREGRTPPPAASTPPAPAPPVGRAPPRRTPPPPREPTPPVAEEPEEEQPRPEPPPKVLGAPRPQRPPQTPPPSPPDTLPAR